ncbi:thiamine phosphate synthase [Ktedonosporobacter rubrisoli]|uniref:Thiamine-phosphate synthase n=1 Tax=Ktedonosporobacter rubrisoli TaxID=2509675 RepID=A0A4P6JN08_KTERU|nr:thiamine phosphate synthase [Ktedonosporobacter rubrisoli]QBD76655.1 thiamine phosphate synthase [Ktedonosporobacter rubrisoli]
MSKLQLTYPVLCLVTDPDITNLYEKVDGALAAGVTMLQLRGHGQSARELYKLGLTLCALCQRYNATFIVNDRIDVGLACGADGFQLGVRSLPPGTVRRLVGERYLLGASIHTTREALQATADGVDFLLAGTIFPSASHPGDLPAGPALLRSIRDCVPNLPLLAIGGITHLNAKQAIEAGASGIAVISAILAAEDIEQAVGSLRAAIHRSLENNGKGQDEREGSGSE